jgi:hypothetical protein
VSEDQKRAVEAATIAFADAVRAWRGGNGEVGGGVGSMPTHIDESGTPDEWCGAMAVAISTAMRVMLAGARKRA